jgi:hypothetical protein
VGVLSPKRKKATNRTWTLFWLLGLYIYSCGLKFVDEEVLLEINFEVDVHVKRVAA